MPTDQNGFYIELRITPDPHGGVYVRSDDVPGLHLQGRYMESMKPMVEEAIKRLFRDNRGENVKVIWLENTIRFPVVENVPERLERLAICKEAA